MYVNFKKSPPQRVLYFVNLTWIVFFPTGYDVCGALNLTKGSLFNCSPILIFPGGPNGILHADKTFSRKARYKRRVKDFR